MPLNALMPLNDGAIFAGFRIVRRLGSGGMGEVYLIQHPRLPRRNALKILSADLSADPEYRARFNREADLASTLYHPHIVGVHDRGECNGQLWLSMDFVDGHDAGRLLASRYPAGMPVDMGPVDHHRCGKCARRRTQAGLAAPRRETGEHHAHPCR
jgi:serine/threonine-protein kinase